MKAIFLWSALLLAVQPSWAQKKQTRADSLNLKQLEKTDLIDFVSLALKPKFNSKESRPGEIGTVHFSVIPIAPASSGHGKVAVSAINASFYLGKQTNISSIYFYPYTNFSTSYGITLTPYIWLDKNLWNGTGDFRIIHNALPDYGLGAGSSQLNFTQINHSQIRAYLTAHTRVKDFFYMGAGYNLDYFFGVGEEDPTSQSPSEFSTYGPGTGAETTSAGVTFNILCDSRMNSVNPTNGFYTTAILRVNKKQMGSTFDWSSLYIDGRKYYSFSNMKHKIFAIHGFYWAAYGDVPYLNLPATFEDPSGRAGRGYATDRFRGKQMMFGEAEYRFDITSHGFLGAVLFVNAQTFTESVSEKFQSIRPAAGFGLRLKFNRYSDTNIALDFAWGNEGLNFYVNLGEYF